MPQSAVVTLPLHPPSVSAVKRNKGHIDCVVHPRVSDVNNWIALNTTQDINHEDSTCDPMDGDGGEVPNAGSQFIHKFDRLNKIFQEVFPHHEQVMTHAPPCKTTIVDEVIGAIVTRAVADHMGVQCLAELNALYPHEEALFDHGALYKDLQAIIPCTTRQRKLHKEVMERAKLYKEVCKAITKVQAFHDGARVEEKNFNMGVAKLQAKDGGEAHDEDRVIGFWSNTGSWWAIDQQWSKSFKDCFLMVCRCGFRCAD